MSSCCMLLLSLSLLFASAAANTLVVGTELLNVTELTNTCVGQHGLLYSVGVANQGFISVAGLAEKDHGVKVVQSEIGA